MALDKFGTKLQSLLHEIVRRTPTASEPERDSLHEAVRLLDPDHRPAAEVAGADPAVQAQAAQVASETTGPRSVKEAAEAAAAALQAEDESPST